MLRFLLLCITWVFLISGCDSEPKKEQVYQLAVVFQNQAWGTSRYGLYLTADGELFSYVNNEKIENYGSVIVGESYSESYLDTLMKYSDQLLETIDSSVHNTLINKIKGVSDANISEPTTKCQDAGKFTLVSFEFNSSTGEYTPILLEERGNVVSVNFSEDAKYLVEWLDSKLIDYQIGTMKFCSYGYKHTD